MIWSSTIFLFLSSFFHNAFLFLNRPIALLWCQLISHTGKYELINPSLPRSSSYLLQYHRSLPPYRLNTELAARFYHRLALKELAKHKRDTMKSLSLSALTSSLLLMMMLNTISCGASISLPKVDGDVPLYSSIADSYMDLEFMMDSEINRILSTGSIKYPTTGAQRPDNVPFSCGRGIPYDKCVAMRMGRPCVPYHRACNR